MSTIKQIYFLDFYNSLLEGNYESCSIIVQELLSDGIEITDIYVELFQNSLYRIGKKWDKSELSIYHEHLASNIISSLIEKFSPTPLIIRDDKALITCIDKEFHEIGAKMVAKIFQFHGYKTFYLGAAVPSKEIIKFIRQVDPQIIAISWSLYINLPRFFEVLDDITKIFPDKKIYVGGQALNEDSVHLLSNYKNVKHISCVKNLSKDLVEL
jgi:methanogenic corrinoid protein MtbC1